MGTNSVEFINSIVTEDLSTIVTSVFSEILVVNSLLIRPALRVNVHQYEEYIEFEILFGDDIQGQFSLYDVIKQMHFVKRYGHAYKILTTTRFDEHYGNIIIIRLVKNSE